MNMELLQKQVRALATLPETEAPVVSCYLNLNKNSQDLHNELLHRMQQLSLSNQDQKKQRLIDRAFSEIIRYLKNGLESDSKGIVFFARSGNTPFFLKMQFQVPVPTKISIDTVPNIYHLIELKDTYDRYVVILADKREARIFEICLGTVTKELWIEHPELRQRVGREWTQLHYQNNCRERGKQFTKETLKALEHLISAEGHSHLILAGDKRVTNELFKSMPKHLAVKVLDVVSLSKQSSSKGVVTSTIASFIAAEESESLTMVERLFNSFNRGQLAEIGPAECLQAAIRGQMDTLVISQINKLEIARWCNICGWVAIGEPLPTICTECGNLSLNERDVREELIRLAERSGCTIETVRDSLELDALGGIGCLLRYAIEPSERPMHQ